MFALQKKNTILHINKSWVACLSYTDDLKSSWSRCNRNKNQNQPRIWELKPSSPSSPLPKKQSGRKHNYHCIIQFVYNIFYWLCKGTTHVSPVKCIALTVTGWNTPKLASIQLFFHTGTTGQIFKALSTLYTHQSRALECESLASLGTCQLRR